MAARDLFVWFSDSNGNRLIVDSVLDRTARFIIVERGAADDENLAVDLTPGQALSLAEELILWAGSFDQAEQ